jgi:UDP-3-O-[3-hydroxymyristoyl] glucosamine N-acyltransferase
MFTSRIPAHRALLAALHMRRMHTDLPPWVHASKDVLVGDNVQFRRAPGSSHAVTIHDRAVIKCNTTIHAPCIIERDAVVGSDVVIAENSGDRPTVIGYGVTIHNGALVPGGTTHTGGVNGCVVRVCRSPVTKAALLTAVTGGFISVNPGLGLLFIVWYCLFV